MENPRQTSIGSNMPSYPWLLERVADAHRLPAKIRVQRMLGVPYDEMTPEEIQRQYDEQAAGIVENLRQDDIYVEPDREIVALIAYLQQLGVSRNLNAEVAQQTTP
jgi:cytochrome c oxidase cbb3-type subunit I/II